MTAKLLLPRLQLAQLTIKLEAHATDADLYVLKARSMFHRSPMPQNVQDAAVLLGLGNVSDVAVGPRYAMITVTAEFLNGSTLGYALRLACDAKTEADAQAVAELTIAEA